MKMNRIAKWSLAALSAAAFTAAGQTVAPQQAPAAHEKEYTGMVTSVNDQLHTMTVRGTMFHKTFSLGQSCNITRWDNTSGTMTDLRPGEKVKVGYLDAQGVLAADRVEQIPLDYQGMVKSLDTNQNYLVLQSSMGRERKLTLADNCRIMLRDNASGQISDIQPGDHVTVVYEEPSGSEIARQITQSSQSFTGSLTAIDLNARTVSAKDVFGVKQFNLAKDCAIVINGQTDAPLMDLRPGERLMFNYDEINGVNVANRIAPAPNSREATTAQANP